MANRSVILELIVQDKNSARVTKRLKNEFGAVEKSANGATAAMVKGNKRVTGSTINYAKAQSNANQTLFSFGDLVNDAQQFQFGFASGSRAIGNNVGFMAEQFSNVQTRAGGFVGALKAMGKSLIGPGGIILGLNLVISAATLFGEKLFGGDDSIAKKAKKAREELQKTREELDKFGTQFDALTSLQKAAFPDLDEGQALQQQLQFATQIEATLQNRLDAETEQVEMLRKQVDLFEQLKSGELTANEALAEGLISRQVAIAIAQDRVDIEGTLISKQNQLNEAQIQQQALQSSISIAQTTQVELTSELVELEAIRDSTLFKTLQTLKAIELTQKARASVEDPERPEDVILGEEIDTGGVDLDLGERMFPEGSLGALRQRLQSFRTELESATNPDTIQQLNKSIVDTQDEMKNLQGGVKVTGGELIGQIGQAAAMQILLADNAEEAASRVIDTIIAQIVAFAIKSAMASLPFPLNILAGAAAAAAGKGLSSLIPSFQTGIDDFEGGMARVHQGEVITMLPPGANVITNENVQALERMRSKSMAGASNLMGMSAGGGMSVEAFQRAVISAIERSRVRVVVDEVDEALDDFRTVKDRVGDG